MDQTRTTPRTFSLPERVQIARTLRAFGLDHVRLPGITTLQQPCHGYPNGCTCGCKAKPDQAQDQPAQPWEPRTSRRAA